MILKSGRLLSEFVLLFLVLFLNSLMSAVAAATKQDTTLIIHTAFEKRRD